MPEYGQYTDPGGSSGGNNQAQDKGNPQHPESLFHEAILLRQAIPPFDEPGHKQRSPDDDRDAANVHVQGRDFLPERKWKA